MTTESIDHFSINPSDDEVKNATEPSTGSQCTQETEDNPIKRIVSFRIDSKPPLRSNVKTTRSTTSLFTRSTLSNDERYTVNRSLRGFNRFDFHETFIQTALNNAGKRAYGIMAIEVWTLATPGLNESLTNWDGRLLKCVNGGTWLDPIFDVDEECAPLLSQLTDTSVDGHFHKIPVKPGEELVGTLFEKEKKNLDRTPNWYDLQQMLIDKKFESNRLQALAKIFGLALGMYFKHSATGTEGIVIYFARYTANRDKLLNATNQRYLKATTNMLGSVVSWKEPRAQVAKISLVNAKERWRKSVLRVILNNIIGGTKNEYNDPQGNKEEKKCDIYTILSGSNAFMKRYITKLRGGGFQIPPSASFSRSMFVFLGCLSSLLTLSLINERIYGASGGKLYIILGPLGALVTCHYGLTSAPATQPRNAVAGSLLSSLIAITSTYIPVEILPIWIRSAIVPAVTISTTLRLGLVHPPAGAMAVLFASAEKAEWLYSLLLIAGYVMATIYAAIFINLNEGKRYPIYWGFGCHYWSNENTK